MRRVSAPSADGNALAPGLHMDPGLPVAAQTTPGKVPGAAELALDSETWFCTNCGVDLGPMNPRQLCGKTFCYERIATPVHSVSVQQEDARLPALECTPTEPVYAMSPEQMVAPRTAGTPQNDDHADSEHVSDEEMDTGARQVRMRYSTDPRAAGAAAAAGFHLPDELWGGVAKLADPRLDVHLRACAKVTKESWQKSHKLCTHLGPVMRTDASRNGDWRVSYACVACDAHLTHHGFSLRRIFHAGGGTHTYEECLRLRAIEAPFSA